MPHGYRFEAQPYEPMKFFDPKEPTAWAWIPLFRAGRETGAYVLRYRLDSHSIYWHFSLKAIHKAAAKLCREGGKDDS